MSVSVTSLLLKTLENATKEYARECVRRCSVEYGFDATEALLNLDLENLRVGVKEMKKRSSGKKEAKEVPEKKAKAMKEVKCSIKLPFIESELKASGCFGLAYNCGLFTQCQKARMTEGSYCKTCQKEADSSSAGKPIAGTVEDRVSVGLMEYRDLKGRKVVAYSKVYGKDGLDRSKVEEEALKVNIVIPPEHFESAIVEKAGRRKIVKKKKDVVPEASVEDLFATLLLGEDDDDESERATVVMSDSEDEGEDLDLDLESARQELEHEKEARNEMKGEDKQSKLAAIQLSKEEKAAKLAAEKESKAAKLAAEKEEKAAKLLAEKEEKAAKLLAEKEEKAAKLAAEKAAKELKLAEEKAAKELKLAAEKAAKEEKLAAEKAAKEEKLAAEKAAKEEKLAAEKAAKEEKLAAEKAAKELKLAAEKAAKEAKAAPVKVAKKATKAEEKPVPKAAVAASEAPKKVTVKRITIEGKQYLKTAENLLYDPETKDEVGIYDEATNSIKALPEDDDDEIDEDGYETDN